MGTQFVSVTSTLPQTILKQVPESAMIQNVGSSTVWISEYPNVAPGLGISLAAGSSLSITSDAQQVYACLDTTNSGPTTLVVTTTMNSVLVGPTESTTGANVSLVSTVYGAGTFTTNYVLTGYTGLAATLSGTRQSKFIFSFGTDATQSTAFAFTFESAGSNITAGVLVPVITPYLRITATIVGSNGGLHMLGLGNLVVDDIKGPYVTTLRWT